MTDSFFPYICLLLSSYSFVWICQNGSRFGTLALLRFNRLRLINRKCVFTWHASWLSRCVFVSIMRRTVGDGFYAAEMFNHSLEVHCKKIAGYFQPSVGSKRVINYDGMFKPKMLGCLTHGGVNIFLFWVKLTQWLRFSLFYLMLGWKQPSIF